MATSRRTRATAAAVLVGVLVGALAGCAAMPWTDHDGEVVTLARLEGHDVAEGRLTSDLLEIAYDEATAERLWQEQVDGDLADASGAPDAPGRYGGLADVDLDTHVLALWSSGASGSCPSWLSDVTSTDDGVIVALAGSGGEICTGDDRPYLQVVAVPRDAVPTEDALPVAIVDAPLPGEHEVRVYGE